MGKWFILEDEQVTGPFTTDEVMQKLASGLPEERKIWGSVMKEWKTLGWWKGEVQNLTPLVQYDPNVKAWHYAFENETIGPMTRMDLLAQLKAIPNRESILLWTKGMKSWAAIFEFHDIIDELGMSRRKYPRAPIDGVVVVSFDNQQHVGKLCTIAEGGCGIKEVPGLRTGQVVLVDLQSESLGQTFKARAEVRYMDDTYIGLKFQSLNSEARGIIIDYMKSFAPAGNGQQQAA